MEKGLAERRRPEEATEIQLREWRRNGSAAVLLLVAHSLAMNQQREPEEEQKDAEL